MCMVQLWIGWETGKDTSQNIDSPFVLRTLREAAMDEEIAVAVVKVPGAPETSGLTTILYPRKSPYKERAEHLASFGAQAALVAGSPYYQTLIGRCLGYKEENIQAHVKQYNGIELAMKVSDLVDEDLAKLSATPL